MENQIKRPPLMLTGEPVSSGIGRGWALHCDCSKEAVVPRKRVKPAQIPQEIARFDAAVAAAERNLQALQNKIEGHIDKTATEIFEAQILFLRDAQLRDSVRKVCVEEQLNAEAAVADAIEHLLGVFQNLDDPFFRERAADLNDVGKRLLTCLAENRGPDMPETAEDCVIVTSNLLSSVVAGLDGGGVRGLIVEKGGPTAHATILARALGIPMLVHVQDATSRIRPGDLLIVDALAGRIFINPRPEILRKYDQLEVDLQMHQSALKGLIDLPAVTRDGVEVKLCANIGQTADAVAAANVKADGAGLYRTEFIFLVQDHFPSEEEQLQLYRATAEHLQPGETVIRVLDIGSDKPLPYFPLAGEVNPALGCRGTRLLLTHPTVLQTQLRAILRLSASHPVAILLPMIGGMDELRAAKAALENAKAELAGTGQPFNPRIPLGAMIETPSAAILIRQLAGEVDFFGVGTNDLVQYLLAADRISDESASAYEPLHPAVLQVLATLATTARVNGKPISLCGEIASDPTFTPLLLGLGYRSFSVSPARLLEIKHAIRSTHLSEAEELAGKVLSLTSIREIKAHLQEDWNRRRPVSSREIGASGTSPVTSLAVTHNVNLQRFEAQAADAPLAFLSYTQEGDRVILDHTFVPDELRGRGLAAALVRTALHEARQLRWKIVPLCSYVATFIKRNPEFADLVEKQAAR
ncbi:MAG: phosphoenolpyruvate--protein phosphotransferase [Opitutales bacterium]